MKKQTKKTENKPIIISVPGAENPWFIYEKGKRKSSHGFKTYAAAQRYLKTEFGR